jgi:hypothetical protein
VSCQNIFKARELEKLITLFVEVMFKNISRALLRKLIQVYVLRIDGHNNPF